MCKPMGRHKSVPKELRPELPWLWGLPGVRRVILGRVSPCRHRYPDGHVLLMADLPAGFRCRGYFGGGLVELWVYVEVAARAAVRGRMLARWPEVVR